MPKIVLVRSLPPNEGQVIGGGYEKSGLTKAPGTFSKKRIYRDFITNKLDTGMLYKVPNPNYVPEEIPNPKYKSEEKTPNESKTVLNPAYKGEPKEIWKWEEMEQKLNYPKGTLSPNSPFWQEFSIRLYTGTNKFDVENPMDELRVLVMKATKEVLPTLGMRNTAGWQNADFYIEDIEQEAELKMSINDSKIRATEEFVKLSTDMRRRFARILGIVKSSNPSDKVISAQLFDYIDSHEKNRKEFLNLVGKTQENIIAHDEYLQAKECGLIKRVDGKYYRVLPDGKIGTQVGVDDSSCIQFILDIQNNEFRAELRDAINSYRKMQMVS